MSVTVTGGVDGITANLDDLAAVGRLVQSGCDSISEVLDDLAAPVLRWILEIGAAHDPCGAQIVRDGLAALAGPSGRLPSVQARMQRLVMLLITAIMAYHDAEQTVLDSIRHGLAQVAIGLSRIACADYVGGEQALFAALPGMTDLTMTSVGWLEDPYARLVPDGHAVLHDLGVDPPTATDRPPHTLRDLVAGLALCDTGRAGEISVAFVRGADGRRRAIVDIPGTKSWNPAPNHDVTSVGTDIRALAGRQTAYEQGVFEALEAAGVHRDEEVMLVGHSEGGIVAVNAAYDAGRSGRFHITHVVTAGAPIGVVAQRLPARVQVLALERTADLVPHLDAAPNPDRPNITTVTVSGQQPSVTGNHDLDESYLPAADAADHSGSASVDAFLNSAHGFLDSSTTQTHGYRITRGF